MPDPILSIEALGPPPWPTDDPFLFCVHHVDRFPAGNGKGAPAVALTGRRLGHDFDNKDGWNMYHGQEIPGFPAHPHRGFETLTVVLQGLLDHADSLGSAARYGNGDAQWMTAGAGLVHSEMFPLLKTGGGNTAELFQLWINLPPQRKLVQPGYKMLWSEEVPLLSLPGAQVRVIAGAFQGAQAPSPPKDSWASEPGADLAVWVLRLEAGASLELPAAAAGLNRSLYLFDGGGLKAGGQQLGAKSRLRLRSDLGLSLQAGSQACGLLLLQGRPIGAPVASYGPFVMNTREEIMQAMEDYQRTQFGRWPWPDEAPIHGLEPQRFAKHPDGRLEKKA